MKQKDEVAVENKAKGKGDRLRGWESKTVEEKKRMKEQRDRRVRGWESHRMRDQDDERTKGWECKRIREEGHEEAKVQWEIKQ